MHKHMTPHPRKSSNLKLFLHYVTFHIKRLLKFEKGPNYHAIILKSTDYLTMAMGFLLQITNDCISGLNS